MYQTEDQGVMGDSVRGLLLYLLGGYLMLDEG